MRDSVSRKESRKSIPDAPLNQAGIIVSPRAHNLENPPRIVGFKGVLYTCPAGQSYPETRVPLTIRYGYNTVLVTGRRGYNTPVKPTGFPTGCTGTDIALSRWIVFLKFGVILGFILGLGHAVKWLAPLDPFGVLGYICVTLYNLYIWFCASLCLRPVMIIQNFFIQIKNTWWWILSLSTFIKSKSDSYLSAIKFWFHNFLRIKLLLNKVQSNNQTWIL